ncbi:MULTISPECIES: pullulanase-type alpha-1,6-glucosidase [unclassified Corallococcus]|uniref:pullulanase-type alpha-1,6-glucosidase n=1 Tax=unclassified Corallococcus TaxID=2685029 RepID=UPI001A8DF706|nr:MULTISPECIES: pullulanase-type alpha-1,6-glucosidase [unclassified Corallococcus]MBN9681100.1 pullulanase-type alpha-1,6-glucosidase [Corallococcus sp. NCSPR001]WAS87306.1 pullulanase-type alpha-1,6-glucosidase [Corallococcus sp. NCRR]
MTRALAFGGLLSALLPLSSLAAPTSVTVIGDLQTGAGCATNNDPTCAQTALAYDADDDKWTGTFSVPAGTWHFKVALDGSLTQTYGGPGGADVVLTQATAGAVKFYFDATTHFVTSNRSGTIATVAGSFQSELGCPGDWQPDCLRSMMHDLDGDGIYTFTTKALPAGNYECKVALDEQWTTAYPGGNASFAVEEDGQELIFTFDSGASKKVTIRAAGAPAGNLLLARAHWISRDTVVWSPEVAAPAGTVFKLHTAPTGGMTLNSTGVQGGTTATLTVDAAGLTAAQAARFPNLVGRTVLKLAEADVANAATWLKGQVAVSATNAEGVMLDATSAQFAGVLDDLDTYDGALGATFENGIPTLRLWAPTAKNVNLLLFADGTPTSTPTRVPMTAGDKGVWSVTGDASWKNRFFLYEVEVYARKEGKVVTNRVTDPYSVALSTNSELSQIVDLADPALAPQGWSTLAKPALEAPEDIVLYELHARDFSINDLTVPENERGTFKAFTRDSDGMKHLTRLAKAGLTHVHLLPVFDIATINEDRAAQQHPQGDLVSLPPDSDQQQAAVKAVADLDGFNWGYDPFHYTVPEGSYSTNAQGTTRTVEFREMVQSLNQHGLRVVMDVVYNHTNSAGQDAKSVLDRIVPGYYHRLSDEGNVEMSTCCQNTASENAMMEKLLIDSVVTWAKAYKVDGFRFDLMGHHMKSNMVKLRAVLDGLTVEKDGVDGKAIYVYGEGWDFGEVAGNARGTNATQANMAGTGIGSFNDRLRDGARGGGPFSGLQEQGFITGLLSDPNGTNQGTDAEQKDKLLRYSDWIRVGLTGNLKDYSLVDRTGATVTGEGVDYNGAKAGYTLDPQEVITYVSAHDNETLFDAVQLKARRDLPMAERVRMHNLGISLVALGQGIPFFHAGDELLRSKSLDRNSYNSGDWFNKVDWTYQSNNWGVGLPPAADNQGNWGLFGPLLADAALKPTNADILRARDHFEEMLTLRKSSRLFRLRTGDEVKQLVRFENTGPGQIPGLIVMAMQDHGTNAEGKRAIVLFNGTDDAQTFKADGYKSLKLKLHPVLAASTDPVVRTSAYDAATGGFTVPARSTAVFVTDDAVVDPDPDPNDPGDPQDPDESDGCNCQSTVPGPLGATSLLMLCGLALKLRRRRA